MAYLQHVSLLLCGIFLELGTMAAQTPTPRPVGRDVQVELVTPVKAKKSKAGDIVTGVTVTQVTLPEGTVVPPGAKVLGQVRHAEPDSGDEHISSIVISFDEIQIKKGKTVPLNCFVRAAWLPKLKGVMAQGEEQSWSNLPPVAGPGMMRNGPSTDINKGVAEADASVQAHPGDSSSPTAPVRTGQVIGMEGVELQITKPDHFAVFKSRHKNLELNQGLELVVGLLE